MIYLYDSQIDNRILLSINTSFHLFLLIIKGESHVIIFQNRMQPVKVVWRIREHFDLSAVEILSSFEIKAGSNIINY